MDSHVDLAKPALTLALPHYKIIKLRLLRRFRLITNISSKLRSRKATLAFARSIERIKILQLIAINELFILIPP